MAKKRNNRDSGQAEDVQPVDTLAQTENFVVWTSEDDGELVYHLELEVMTLHFYREDWDELVTLIKDAEFNRQNK